MFGLIAIDVEEPQRAPVRAANVAFRAPSRGFCIRRCDIRDDAAALFDLFGSPEYGRAALPEPFASPQAVANWLAGHGAQAYQIVAERAGCVVGFAGLYPYVGRQSHAGFFTIGVLPDHQRCGVGTSLLTDLLVAADAMAGLRRLELTVLADNEKAIRLYRRSGFVVEGRHRCYVHDGEGFVDGLTMARVRDGAACPG